MRGALWGEGRCEMEDVRWKMEDGRCEMEDVRNTDEHEDK